MPTVGELIGLYEGATGGKFIDSRVTYFHGLSRNFMRHYLDVSLADINGKMSVKEFRYASCTGLRFEGFQSGTEVKRYTLMVSRDGSPISFE